MDFIEVLIVLAFIVLPLLEGVFRQRKGKGESPGRAPRPQRERERLEARVPAGAPDARPRGDDPAAEMIPAELWEILTGERRTTTVPGPAPEPSPWETSPEERGQDFETPVGAEESGADGGLVLPPWESPAEWRDESRGSREGATTEGESLEYVGPEAVSLEQPLPAPEVRHRRFHERYDTPAALTSATPQPSALVRELRAGLRANGLRRSILLAEILGPPRGLS